MSTLYSTIVCSVCNTTLPLGTKCVKCAPMTEERVREIAREEIGAHIARTEPIAHYFTVGGSTQPAAQASAEKPDHENAALRNAALRKERDLLRQRCVTADTIADELRAKLAAEEKQSGLRAVWLDECREKLAASEKALDEIVGAITADTGWKKAGDRIEDALKRTGRLGGKEQGK